MKKAPVRRGVGISFPVSVGDPPATYECHFDGDIQEERNVRFRGRDKQRR